MKVLKTMQAMLFSAAALQFAPTVFAESGSREMSDQPTETIKNVSRLSIWDMLKKIPKPHSINVKYFDRETNKIKSREIKVNLFIRG